MGRSCLLLFRMHCLHRLFLNQAIYYKTDTEKDERHAEPLAHVKHHILFESYLRFLDELDKEAHSEKNDKEAADECTLVHLLCVVFIKKDKDDSENGVA